MGFFTKIGKFACYELIIVMFYVKDEKLEMKNIKEKLKINPVFFHFYFDFLLAVLNGKIKKKKKKKINFYLRCDCR